jgi:uncharacterized membrane protein
MSNSKSRPKIKFAKTKVEWLWDIIGYSIYLGTILFLANNWNEIPEKVPAHFNALGEVDRWGTKMELLILPIVGSLITVLMQVIEKFPEMHNYPNRLNEINAKEFYLLSRKMINSLKNICLLIFSLLLFESITIALGRGEGFGALLLPTILLSVFIPIIIGIMKQQKIR